jgi:hypothetical protein
VAERPPIQQHTGGQSDLVHGAQGSRVDVARFISRRGLHLPRQISFEKWLGIGKHLSGIRSWSAWCLGDWLVYGETAFNGRYRDAIDLTSLDYQTLRNYAWVARRFSLSRRRDKLSFGHHAEVAALPEREQEYWLRKAEEYSWSVKRLRHEVRTSIRERAVDDGGQKSSCGGQSQADSETIMLMVPILAGDLKSCKAAAKMVGLNVQDWAGQILTQAAFDTGVIVKTA